MKRFVFRRMPSDTPNYMFRVWPWNIRVLEGVLWVWGFWLRVFGHGIAIKKQELFSERNRLRKRTIYIGDWMIERLVPYYYV